MKRRLADFGTAFQHGGSIVLITGNPDGPFIQSVLLSVKNVESIICMVVVKRDDPALQRIEDDIRLAKSKGITVHLLGREQFTDAFKEVVRL